MTHFVFSFCYSLLLNFLVDNTYFLLLVQLNIGGSFRRLGTKVAVIMVILFSITIM